MTDPIRLPAETVALVTTLTAKRGAITALQAAPLTWHTVENARKALQDTIHAAMALIEALPSQDTPKADPAALSIAERWFLRQATESEGGAWFVACYGAGMTATAKAMMQRGFGVTMAFGDAGPVKFWLNGDGLAAMETVQLRSVPPTLTVTEWGERTLTPEQASAIKAALS